MKRALVLAILLAPAAALADYPHGPGLAPQESASIPPTEVCNQMLEAARNEDYDALIARTSIYARTRIGAWDKFLLRLAHSRLAEARCVRADVTGDQAMVQIYQPNGHSTRMPFLREEGVWRFDQHRWEELRHAGQAPKP